MANELLIHYPTGATLYALLFDSTGQVWNGSAFAAPGSADWLDYDIAMTEAATATGIYRASMPAAAAGVYGWVVRKQAGANPAVGDIVVGSGEIRWTGTAEFVPLTAQETADAVNKLAPTAGDPAAGSVGAKLDMVGPGAGSETFTYTLLNTSDDSPIPQARIEVFTDEAMTNRVRIGYTDDFGQVTFYLDPGTYYFRRLKADWIFTNPDTETVEEPAP